VEVSDFLKKFVVSIFVFYPTQAMKKILKAEQTIEVVKWSISMAFVLAKI